jgi:preprotein translocase SecF subunit
MFHLTRKKYIFFAISLLVIVPGTLALIFWHLNPGIDFTGGTTVDLQFAKSLPTGSVSTITQVFSQQLKAKDTQVYIGHQINQGSIQTFWVELSTTVDQNVQSTILSRFTSDSKTFGTVKALPTQTLTTDGGKTHFSLLPFQFTPPSGGTLNVTTAEIDKALANLPNTTPVASTASTAPTATPTAGATATATATASPTATATATAGSSSSSSSSSTTATIPVKLVNVYEGNTNEIVTVQTQTALTPAQLQTAENALYLKYGPIYQSQVQQVSPSIAQSTTIEAILAVVVAAVFILVYITFAFRNVGSVSQSFRYGACAIIALLHDALVVLGIWAILGHFFPVDFQVDTLFVTAVLTVIGFSVHDTIVVFDRIRENTRHRSSETFVEIVNASLLQTMARSINTSLTVLLTLSALVLFGGASIRTFTLALLIGIFSGTYSSIFNASMLLVVMETGEWRSWFPWLQPKPGAAATTGRRVGVATR